MISKQRANYSKRQDGYFPVKLWNLCKNPEYDDVIHWSVNGARVIFPDDDEFTDRILASDIKIFNTKMHKSFVRQLNLYGFVKVQIKGEIDLSSFLREDEIERNKWPDMVFEHPKFHRDHPEWLKEIRRRCRVRPSNKEESQDREAIKNLYHRFDQVEQPQVVPQRERATRKLFTEEPKEKVPPPEHMAQHAYLFPYAIPAYYQNPYLVSPFIYPMAPMMPAHAQHPMMPPHLQPVMVPTEGMVSAQAAAYQNQTVYHRTDNEDVLKFFVDEEVTEVEDDKENYFHPDEEESAVDEEDEDGFLAVESN